MQDNAGGTTAETPQVVINLGATYTVTYPGDDSPTTIRTVVRARPTDGGEMIVVRNLAPLLAEQIDAIADEGDRLHTLTVLSGAIIGIRDTPDDTIPDGELSGSTYRDRGMLGTTYAGTRDLPVDTVLDLAEKLREQFKEA